MEDHTGYLIPYEIPAELYKKNRNVLHDLFFHTREFLRSLTVSIWLCPDTADLWYNKIEGINWEKTTKYTRIFPAAAH